MKLILGGSGQLGTSFRRNLPDAVSPPHSELDVTDTEQVDRYLAKLTPELIINCCGYTNVDGAENDPDQAMAVNGKAVGELANCADLLGIPFVTFSSDYVFDGLAEQPYVESSQPNPINAYGRSKLAGEVLALASRNSLVVRTSWIFSASHPNFVATILKNVGEGSPVRVVNDQFGRPTHVDDVVQATLGAMEFGLAGLVHVATGPTVSWFELACEAVGSAGFDVDLVLPCATAEYAVLAPRPRWSVLESERTNDVVGLGSWKDRLPDTVDSLVSRLFS